MTNLMPSKAADVGSGMTECWKLTIEIHSRSFSGIKRVFERARTLVVSAQTHRDLYCKSGDSDGNGLYIEVVCPVETQIADLRRRANELEAGLSK